MIHNCMQSVLTTAVYLERFGSQVVRKGKDVIVSRNPNLFDFRRQNYYNSSSIKYAHLHYSTIYQVQTTERSSCEITKANKEVRFDLLYVSKTLYRIGLNGQLVF